MCSLIYNNKAYVAGFQERQDLLQHYHSQE